MNNPPRYAVHGADGAVLMHTDSDFRSPPHIELNILSAGYTIRRNGKKVTKKEILQNAEQSNPHGPLRP